MGKSSDTWYDDWIVDSFEPVILDYIVAKMIDIVEDVEEFSDPNFRNPTGFVYKCVPIDFASRKTDHNCSAFWGKGVHLEENRIFGEISQYLFIKYCWDWSAVLCK